MVAGFPIDCQDCKGATDIATTPRVRNFGPKGLDMIARGRASEARRAKVAPPRVRTREPDRALKVHDHEYGTTRCSDELVMPMQGMNWGLTR